MLAKFKQMVEAQGESATSTPPRVKERTEAGRCDRTLFSEEYKMARVQVNQHRRSRVSYAFST
jgi:hypothetical protein